MADGTIENLDPEKFQKLMEMGHISKETLDKIYLQNGQEMAVEEDAQNQAIADELTNVIQSDPKVGDIATRIAENVMPQRTAAPPMVTPIPEMARRGAPAAPTATPAPQLSSGPPVQEAPSAPSPEDMAQMQAESAGQEALISGVQAQKVAEVGDQLGVLDLQSRAFQQKRNAIMAEAQAVSAGAQKEVAALGQAFKDSEAKASAAEQKRLEYQSEFDRLLTVQEKAINEYSNLKLNPDRVYANMSTPVKILSGLSVFLGGLGHGMGGGDNKGYERIKEAIKDDINLQKSQIEILGNAIQFRSNLLNDVRQRVGDQMTAEQITQAIMLSRTKLQLQSIASQTKSAAAQAGAQKAIAQINLDIAKALKDAQGGLSSTAMGITNATDPMFDDYSALPKDVQQRVVRGLGVAVSPQQQRSIAEQYGAYQTIGAEVKELKDLINKQGTTVWPTVARDAARTKWGIILGKVKQAERLGALDAGVEKYWKGIVPEDPLGVSAVAPWEYITKRPAISLAKIKEFERYTKRNFINNINPSVAKFDPRFIQEAQADSLTAQDQEAGRSITDSTE